MGKQKLILSTLRLDSNSAALFRSYCHLLQPQLDSRWIVSRLGGNSDVVVVDADDDGSINKKARAKIILEKHLVKLIKTPKKIGKTHVFKLVFPVTSASIVGVLNQISSLDEDNLQHVETSDRHFSFKDTFSKFMHQVGFGEKYSHRNIQASPTKSLVNKLLDTCNPKRMKQLKVVFLGRPGSGKTTAIGNISTSRALRTEVNATDSVGMLKSQTTIGIDYGEYKFENKIMLRLYGTPGQKRYDFVRNQIIKNADICLIMIDLTSPHPFQELNYFNSIINRSGFSKKVIKMIALTHADESKLNVSRFVKKLKEQSNGKLLISVMDPRNQVESKKILKNLAELILNRDLIEQHNVKNPPLFGVQSMTRH